MTSGVHAIDLLRVRHACRLIILFQPDPLWKRSTVFEATTAKQPPLVQLYLLQRLGGCSQSVMNI